MNAAFDSVIVQKEVREVKFLSSFSPSSSVPVFKQERINQNEHYSLIPFWPPLFQNKRLGSLNKFKAKARSILLATDVASRGLDIPHVDVVINFDIPTHSKVS